MLRWKRLNKYPFFSVFSKIIVRKSFSAKLFVPEKFRMIFEYNLFVKRHSILLADVLATNTLVYFQYTLVQMLDITKLGVYFNIRINNTCIWFWINGTLNSTLGL